MNRTVRMMLNICFGFMMFIVSLIEFSKHVQNEISAKVMPKPQNFTADFADRTDRRNYDPPKTPNYANLGGNECGHAEAPAHSIRWSALSCDEQRRPARSDFLRRCRSGRVSKSPRPSLSQDRMAKNWECQLCFKFTLQCR